MRAQEKEIELQQTPASRKLQQVERKMQMRLQRPLMKQPGLQIQAMSAFDPFAAAAIDGYRWFHHSQHWSMCWNAMHANLAATRWRVRAAD